MWPCTLVQPLFCINNTHFREKICYILYCHSVIFLCCTNVELEECAGRWLGQYGNTLQVAEDRLLQNKWPDRCLRECYNDPRCLSVGYSWPNKACKLYYNKKTSSLSTTVFPDYDFYSYYCESQGGLVAGLPHQRKCIRSIS